MGARIWTDNPAGLSTDLPVLRKGLSIGSASVPVGTIYADNVVTSGGETIVDLSVTNDLTVGNDAAVTGSVTAGSVLLTDGSDKNYSLTVYAAGTAYSLTAVSAALNFGTTDPVITLDKAGTYALFANVTLNYVGATFAAVEAVTLKLRRTNNTAADVTNSSLVLATDIITTLTYTLGAVALPTVLYTTANTDDAITIFGDVVDAPSAGSVDAVAASIVAVRLY